MAVKVVAGPVIPHRGSRVSVAGSDLHVAQISAGCPVDGLAGRGRQRDQDDRGALAAHAQRPVAVLRAGVADVRAGGFEDPAATPRPGQNGAGPAE